MRSPTVFPWLPAVVWALTAGAVEPARCTAQGGPAGTDGGAKARPELVLPDLTGPRPWTEKPVLDDPRRFQVAILTDRTGGHRPGIWMQAVRGLNLLRPDFAISVGDLIEGYSENEAELDRQWREFLGFVDALEMRFFFVAGNHDVSNAKMHRIWRERFGPEWYSFDYKDVHFLCLSSEDPVTAIGEGQLGWIEQDLASSRGTRWTLVFLHKPLWVTAEREIAAGKPDPTNWQKVERLLDDRPHTVFAGHVHHYVQYDRNGTDYYSLATTGGSSRMRGTAYGEFDHVTWLTMEADGPRVVNLLLDGMLPPDVVTEAGIERFRAFLSKSRLDIRPILVLGGDELASGTIELRLTNEFDVPIRVRGAIAGIPLLGLTLAPERLELEAAPGESKHLDVTFRLGEAVDLDRLHGTELRARLESVEPVPLRAELTMPVMIDREFACPAVGALAIEVDGDLREWPELPLGVAADPTILGRGEEWQGLADCGARFQLAHDSEWLYLAARIADDRVRPGADKVVLALDARPSVERVRDPRLRRGTLRVDVDPSPAGRSTVRLSAGGSGGARGDGGAAAAARPVDGGYTLEVRIPITTLTRAQGEAWASFQLELALVDSDEEGSAECTVLWRGARDFRRRNTGFGHFARD